MANNRGLNTSRKTSSSSKNVKRNNQRNNKRRSPRPSSRDLSNMSPEQRAEYNKKRRIAAMHKRKRRQRKDFFLLFLLIISMFFIFIMVNFRPYKTTTVNGLKLRGKLKITTEFDAPKDYVETGRTYKIKVKKVYTDIFSKTTSEMIGADVSLNVNNKDTLGSNITVNKNEFILDDSLTSGKIVIIKASYKDKNETYSYIIRDDLSNKIGGNNIITNPEEYDALVNKKRHLASDYVPKDLTKVEVNVMQSDKRVLKLRKVASDALTELFKGAKSAGYDLYAVSGFRSYTLQKTVYASNLNQYDSVEEANSFSAKPGESEHQLGLSMDVTSQSVGYKLTQDFIKTKEGKWIKENAYKYGFIIRFPKGKEDITGYAYEPWHVRYVGKDLAKLIYENNLTLEEYFEQK